MTSFRKISTVLILLAALGFVAAPSQAALSVTCSATPVYTVGMSTAIPCTASGAISGNITWDTVGTPPGSVSTSAYGGANVFVTVFITPSSVTNYSFQIRASDMSSPTPQVALSQSFSGTVTTSSGGGGGGSTITGLSPTSINAGSGPFTLTITGSGFSSSTIIYFGGQTYSPATVGANQLTVNIPNSAILNGGTSAAVFVSNNGVNSNTLNFAILASAGPVISSISPASVPAGTSGVTLSVYGSGFSSGQLLNFGSLTSFSTSVQNSNQLTAYIPGAYLTTPQTVNITIGNGTSSFPFMITASSSLSVTCNPSSGPSIVNTSFTQSCSVSGGLAPYVWSVLGLPTGLTSTVYAGANTIQISGTPIVAGNYNYTVQVTDNSSPTHLSGSLAISGLLGSGGGGGGYNLTSISPSSAAVGSGQLVMTVNGNGFTGSSLVYFQVAGSTAQLSTQFLSTTQLLATIPTSLLGTAANAVVNVNTSGILTNSLTFVIGNGTSTGLVINCSPGVGPSVVNNNFTTTCSASGGIAPYTWPQIAGLPSGVTQSATTGPSIILSGTPATASVYNFTIKATDSSNPPQTGSLQMAGQTNSNGGVGGSTTITSVSPSSAALNSGPVSVTILGSGFTSGSLVYFDGTPITTTYLSSAQLVANVPAGQLTFARTALITVSTPGSGTSNGLSFIIGNGGAGGVITMNCSPGVGPSTPGAYFATNCVVNGGTAPYNWTIASGTLPSGLALNPANVTASITGNASQNGPYSYVLSVSDSSASHLTASLAFAGQVGTTSGGGPSGLTITSVSPNSSAISASPVNITVSGTGFTTNSIVTFNGAGLGTTFVSTTQLNASIPASYLATATTAQIVVKDSGQSSNSLTFTVGSLNPTQISISCNPSAGPAIPGSFYTTTCTASGGRAPFTWSTTAGLQALNGIVLTNSTTNTVSITGTTFQSTAYAYSLNVTDSGTPPLTATYMFEGTVGSVTGSGNVGAVTSLSPTSAQVGAGQFTLSVTGLQFDQTSIVLWNGATQLLTTYISPTQLTAIVPASLLNAAGTYDIQVSTGSGLSNRVGFFVSAAAALNLNPQILSFTYATGGSIPSAQNISVTSSANVTGFSVSASTTSGGNWLIANPTSGLIPNTISVSVNPNGLSQGTYYGSLTVTGFGVGSTVTVPVSLTVGGVPALTPNPATLNLSAPAGGAPITQTVQITSSDNNTVLPYTVQAASNNGGAWLSASPTSGNTPSSITVTLDPSKLAPSTYSGNVTLTSPGRSLVGIPVTFTITPPPAITLSPSTLSFSGQTGTSISAQTFSITSSTSAAVGYTTTVNTSSGGSWLTATTSGTTPGTVTVNVNTTGLAAGTYSGSVTVNAPGTTNTPQSVAVTLNLTPAPMLTSTPGSLTFNYISGGAIPATQALAIAANISGTYNYTASATTTTGGNWLTLLSSGGTTPGSITVGITASGLGVGTYTGNIAVSATGIGSANVPVTLTVSAPNNLSVSPQSLLFSAQTGGTAPAAQTLNVSSSAGPIGFTATVATTTGGNWLVATANSGSTPTTVTVSVNATNLTSGTYNGTVTIASNSAANSPQVVPVTLTVTAPPMLFVAPNGLTFDINPGDPDPGPQSVSVFANNGSAQFSVTPSGGNWLSAQGGGGTPGTVLVRVTGAGLQPGQTYSGAVTISAPPATNIQIPVTVNVAPSGGPKILVAPSTVLLSYVQGSTADYSHITVQNTGGGTLTYSATAQANTCGAWLTLSSSNGSATPSTPGSINFTANPTGLPAGTCRGTIGITDSNGGKTVVPVMMVVSSAPQSIVLSQSAMNFTASPGSQTTSQTFQILNPGSSLFQFSIDAHSLSGANWLSVNTTSGTVFGGSAGSAVTVSANPTGLAPGVYYGTVRVFSTNTNNSPATLTVSLNVLPQGQNPPATVAPMGLTLTGTGGGSNSDTQTVTVTNPGSALVTYTAAVSTDDGPGWLNAVPSSGSVAAGGTAQISLSASLGGLTPGLRHGSLRVGFSDGSVQVVDLSLIVTGSGGPVTTTVRSCGQSDLAVQFVSPAPYTPAAARLGLPVQVLVRDCNGNLVSTPDTAVDVIVGNSGTAFRLVSLGSGLWGSTWAPVTQGPTPLTARATRNNFGANPSGQANTVVVVGAPPQPAPPVVAFVGNAASYTLPGLVAPLTMVSIFGQGLANGQTSVSSVPFPTSLQGSQFTLRGQPLPLFFVSDGQVNAVIPANVPSNEHDQLVVARDATQSAPFDIIVGDTDPGIFSTNQQGTGQGAIVSGSGQLVGPVGSAPGAAPAAVGDYIQIYLAGLGTVTNTPPDGSPSTADNLSKTTAAPQVSIGGAPAVVSYSGLAPGNVGLYQINVQVPAASAKGDAVPVVVNIGSGQSNTVTIAVR